MAFWTEVAAIVVALSVFEVLHVGAKWAKKRYWSEILSAITGSYRS